ncbi:FRG domain-containing protein [Methylobacterium sp. NEAU 140]|uniref:FRG domain-containing protein n=1 Tax=Methylobacterium sp. NEAU 140 TaxID=3064945 RepID=UPI002737710C|nr:FRG domain-containing protein [Methylobacterium sp. NEAU 140]MDP4024157.1 FRG domain-containing protein [Methylobacterium sp. NEAU 140]
MTVAKIIVTKKAQTGSAKPAATVKRPLVGQPKIAPIAKLSQYIDEIKQFNASTNKTHLYRGHSKNSYKILPSLFRDKNHRRDEKSIRRELIALHPGEFLEDRSVFDQLVRMQHFSLPTRLMDVSYNPLVGLYFCCKSSKNEDGHVVRFSIDKRLIKYYDSDAISCVANLSNLSGSERNELRAANSTNLIVNCTAGRRLLQFIRGEKPHFLPEIEPEDLFRTHVVKPKQNNKRIIAQQGAFLAFGLETGLLDNNESDIQITRIAIPAASKKSLLDELDVININESSLFPEIESSAKYIMRKITPLSDNFED